MKKYEIIKFKNEKISLDVRIEPNQDTVWLSKDDIALLFNRDRTVISKHIKNIFSEGELEEKSSCAKNARQINGQVHHIEYFNLDVIISVGYRVKSKNGIIFRKWANSVLKQYLLKGYAIENSRAIITNENYSNLCSEVFSLKNRINKVEKEITIFKPNEKVLLENQLVTAFIFVNHLLRTANKQIIIIDGYLDDYFLEYFVNVNRTINITLITHKMNRISEHVLRRFKEEFVNVEIIENKSFHDRFIIVDEAVYSLGTSLNNLGKKLTTIHLMENTNPNDVVTNILNGKISKF